VNDEQKTKQELIAELKELRGELGKVRQQVAEGGDVPTVERQLAVAHVHAEAMAMRSSDDLFKVVGCLWRELNALGLNSPACFVNFIDDTTERVRSYRAIANPRHQGTTWDSSDVVEIDEEVIATVGEFPLQNMYVDLVDHWHKREIRVRHFTKNDNPQGTYRSVLHGMKAIPFPTIPFEEVTQIDVPFAYGIIGVHDVEYADEHVAVVGEMKDAISLGYLRFLDFQKLEKQAEQARRERAVERVRAEAMAMRSSEDLKRVVVFFHRAMEDLGIRSIGCNIHFMDEEHHLIRGYHSYLSPLFTSLLSSQIDPDFPERVIQEHQQPLDTSSGDWGIKCWLNQQTMTKEQGNRTVEMAQKYFESLGYDGGKIGSDTPHIDDFLTTEYTTNVPFKYGIIGFGEQVYDESHITAVQELADALSLGFLRYLDLQELEAQNRRLAVDNGLEKVRAAVASMRDSQDIYKVLTSLDQALESLGINRSPVENDVGAIAGPSALNIMDEPGKRWLVYSGTEDFHYSYWHAPNDPFHRDLLTLTQHWQKQEVYARFPEWHPERWVVDIPFAYGTLGVGGLGGEWTDEQVNLIKQFTEVIALGYSRFLDFQKLDEAQRRLIDELEEELQTAHDLQMGLMPIEPPQIDGFDIRGRCIPANHVGGDFFQYFQQDDRLSVCMADVTGHAMEAAVPVMMFSGVLKTEMRHGASLTDLFGQLNRTMNESLDKRTYVCFTMIELDLVQRRLQLANSGCPYLFHYHASTGNVTELQVDAYPLGVRAETAYTVIEAGLETGDYIVFCSDGIIEAANTEEEMFGFEQTTEAIRKGCKDGLAAEGLIDKLIGAVQDFAGDEPQGDDMTCVVVRVE